MVEAISARNPTAAEELMRRHFKRSIAAIREELEAAPAAVVADRHDSRDRAWAFR